MSESIVNFFEGKTIFLTGGTGFLGKVLVEKLLRVCQVKTLYLLVRPKKGKSVEERFNDYFDFVCFENIKKENLVLKEKIIFINGDCEKPNLGLSEENEEMLIKNVNIVIHAAANVKFDQPLRVAANINVRSTIDILGLAKQMSGLKVFIYVSTAFSNCPNTIIEEKCYPPPMTTEQLFFILDGIPDDALLDEVTPKLLRGWPNAYTFTKSIAEHYLNHEGKGLPIGICRPSIVCVSAQEPVPGWIDNVYGVVGISLTAAIGALRNLNIDPNNRAPLVPCDYACNNILAATWNLAMEKSKEVTFYNSTDSRKNPITWRRYMKLVEESGHGLASKKTIWHYTLKLRKNTTWFKICRFFQHTLAAYLIDFLLICFGRKPLAVEKYAQLDKAADMITYFMLRQWDFVTNNTEKLWEKMSVTDQQLFNFNMADLNWKTYTPLVLLGCRVYLMKDPLETIPQSRNWMRLLAVAHYTFLALWYYLLYSLARFILSVFGAF